MRAFGGGLLSARPGQVEAACFRDSVRRWTDSVAQREMYHESRGHGADGADGGEHVDHGSRHDSNLTGLGTKTQSEA